LTPYNVIIAPHFSPLNNVEFDKILAKMLDGILRGELELQDLVEVVSKLPRQDLGR
jgi:hypothetical protein